MSFAHYCTDPSLCPYCSGRQVTDNKWVPPLTPIPLPAHAYIGASAPYVFHDEVREIVREELDLAVERLAGALIKGLKR